MPFFANSIQIALPIPFSRLVPVTIAICLFIVERNEKLLLIFRLEDRFLLY